MPVNPTLEAIRRHQRLQQAQRDVQKAERELVFALMNDDVDMDHYYAVTGDVAGSGTKERVKQWH